MAVSPDGTKVFVTGSSTGLSGTYDYATVAYDTSTKAKLWVKRYNGPADDYDLAYSLGVSPDGTKVFVTGGSIGSSNSDFATIAYDSLTGATEWVSRYDGPARGGDGASSLEVSPDGSRIFVTGHSFRSIGDIDYATIAYEAATGAKLWIALYDGPAKGADLASTLGLSPDGTQVFVSGGSPGSGSDYDYATIAYSASSGTRLWAKRYNGPGNGYDEAHSLGVSPDGTQVFVTGASAGTSSELNYATIAYNASSGSTLWAKRYDGPGNDFDEAFSLGVNPDGTEVYVTGGSPGSSSGLDYATIAYDSSTGSKEWVSRYNGPGNSYDKALALAVSQDGAIVFVTGGSAGSSSGLDYATIAYDSSTGSKEWVSRYNGPGNDLDSATSLAASPDGTKLFVTGESVGSSTGGDYGAAVYSAV